MNPGHQAFFAAGEGRRFANVLGKPYHIYGYALMCLIGQPAIGAAAWELDPLLEAIPKKRRGFVKQACGAYVGSLMQQIGAERDLSRTGRPRSARVKASRFLTMGAVWTIQPTALKKLAPK